LVLSFSKNWLDRFKFFKNLGKFKIKNLKKLEAIWRILVKTYQKLLGLAFFMIFSGFQFQELSKRQYSTKFRYVLTKILQIASSFFYFKFPQNFKNFKSVQMIFAKPTKPRWINFIGYHKNRSVFNDISIHGIDPETVKDDGEVLTCEPAPKVPLSRNYFLF
jgi:hypothetical protein